MIAREQKLLAVEQHAMAASMSRHRNRDQIAIDLDGGLALNDLFNPAARRAILGMHDSFALEPFGPALVIGHVVLMGQEHCAHAAEARDPFYQLRRPAW